MNPLATRTGRPRGGPVPDLLLAIDDARREFRAAQAYFEVVSEPELIDQAVHLCAAAEKKLLFLLRKAREEGVSYGGDRPLTRE